MVGFLLSYIAGPTNVSANPPVQPGFAENNALEASAPSSGILFRDLIPKFTAALLMFESLCSLEHLPYQNNHAKKASPFHNHFNAKRESVFAIFVDIRCRFRHH